MSLASGETRLCTAGGAGGNLQALHFCVSLGAFEPSRVFAVQEKLYKMQLQSILEGSDYAQSDNKHGGGM